MSNFQYVTKETLEQMKAELQHKRGVERPAASRAIAEAREKGDLKLRTWYNLLRISNAPFHRSMKFALIKMTKSLQR